MADCIIYQWPQQLCLPLSVLPALLKCIAAVESAALFHLPSDANVITVTAILYGRGCPVSPTYSLPHILYNIKCTALEDLSEEAFTLTAKLLPIGITEKHIHGQLVLAHWYTHYITGITQYSKK